MQIKPTKPPFLQNHSNEKIASSI